MAITLQLRTDESGGISALYDGRLLAGPVTPADLPALELLQADPFEQGMALTEALGGHGALAKLMTADPDNLILLDADEPAAAIPWEFAAVPGNQLLGGMYGLLRLVGQQGNLPADTEVDRLEQGTLQFITLTADPLVDKQGRPREGYRLERGNQAEAIRRTLAESGRALQARRIPATLGALRRSLQRGAAVLQLSCHGGVIETKEHGRLAVFFLEDDDGAEELLLGRDLAAMSPPGALRLSLLGGCHTAKGNQVQLAQALVGNGIPAAVGLHSPFPHPLSDALAAALYEGLLAGAHLGEALREARLALLAKDAGAAGLPAGYVSRDGWSPLPLETGEPEVGSLTLPGSLSLSPEVRRPHKLYGRNGELHRLAQLYGQGNSVVSLIGGGGMGRTALAATFAERFAWRWPQGVLATSFAGRQPDAAGFRRELIQALLGEAAVLELSVVPAERQSETIVAALRDWDGLLLLDNYESVLQTLNEPAAEIEAPRAAESQADPFAGPTPASHAPKPTPASHAPKPSPASHAPKPSPLGPQPSRVLSAFTQAGSSRPLPAHPHTASQQVHQLVSRIARSGASLLLASRQPAALPNELLFPAEDQSLEGLPVKQAARLFLERSARANEGRAAHRQLARDIAQATEGHPLAILLLAGEFDQGEAEPADFLAAWVAELVAAELADAELAGAEAAGAGGTALTRQELTLRVAFERNYRRLPEVLQERLRALSVFSFPFLAEGAALVWEMATEEEYVAAAGHDLDILARAGYLDVSGALDSELPPTYRLQAALLPEVSRLVGEEERAKFESGYAAYGAWLARQSEEDLDKERDLVRLSLPALEAATGKLEGTQRLWHLRRLTRLFVAYGETEAAYEALLQAWPEGLPPPDPEENREQAGIISNLHYELAQFCMARGELERALALYEESVQLTDRIGNLEGKAAALSGVADVHMASGNWEAAAEILAESLDLAAQLNWTEEVAADTVKLGQVAQAQDERQMALERYQEALALYEQLEMPQETARLEESIASLRAPEVSEPSQVSRLAHLAAEARTAAQNRRFDKAAEIQEEAVALARELGDTPESLTALTVQLYYLAIYHGRLEKYDEAVRDLEEALSLAKRTGYEQTENIRQALEGARQSAARASAALTPEEQADLKAAAVRKRMDKIADQCRDAAVAALRGEVDRETLAAQMTEAVAQADKEPIGSPRAELATFVWATAALLRGEPVPLVPDAYVSHLNAILQVAKEQEQEPET